jgi:uncharacterized protein YndB with AHSA1/START domain
VDDRVQRELWVPAPPHAVWEAITADGWLAATVELELWPGGEARFEDADGTREGWVEEARAPARDGAEGRLAFWWSHDGDAASRVEITIDTVKDGTRVQVIEARPLEMLELVGLPLARPGGRTYGPALVAA